MFSFEHRHDWKTNAVDVWEKLRDPVTYLKKKLGEKSNSWENSDSSWRDLFIIFDTVQNFTASEKLVFN